MIYVMSDLHGYCLDRIKSTLERIGFSDSDYCYVLGDVIDRGFEGVKILRWLMTQPNITLLLGNHEAMMLSCSFLFDEITDEVLKYINIEVKYEGYIIRQLRQVEQYKKMEKKMIPLDLDYDDVPSLRLEARQKLKMFKPISVGQASRISGVSPADVSVLLVYLEQYTKKK